MEYYETLCNKLTRKMQVSKKLEKIEDEIILLPKFDEYNFLLKYNYNVQQLKNIAKTYKLKVTGNKSQLVSRIYPYLLFSYFISKIQKIVRGYLVKRYTKCHGPAFKNRGLCTNTFDFLSMEDLSNIPNEQFFSFQDQDGFIYGFDVISLYNLVSKTNGTIKNPFNQIAIDTKNIDRLRSLLRLSHILNISIITEIEDFKKDVTEKKTTELRALTLFQHIDLLGNYSNSQWFLSLNRNQLIRFLRELIDIWSYRAPLSIETKRAICPPNGNPFSIYPNYHSLYNIEDIDRIQNSILSILEKMVTTGIDKDSKCLGAYYVLGALTLVNQDAATSLPWLYQAVCYN
jgi:hypothetical protein